MPHIVIILMSTVETREVFTGCVKWFNAAGFGFIKVVSSNLFGKDVYVHYTALGGDGSYRRKLFVGEYVEFYLEDTPATDKREASVQAVEVVGVFAGNLMCETQRLSKAERELAEAEARASKAVSDLDRLKNPAPPVEQKSRGPREKTNSKGGKTTTWEVAGKSKPRRPKI